MRYLIFGFVLMIAACSDPKAELISEYEQIIDGTKWDLSLKVEEIEPLGYITGLDSMRIIHQSSMGDDFDPSLNLVDTTYLMMQASLDRTDAYIHKYDSASKATSDPFIVRINTEALLDTKRDRVDILERRDKWMGIKNEYDKYITMKDSVLGLLVEATYSIKNPILNNMKQTLTKTYVFSADESEILGVIEDSRK